VLAVKLLSSSDRFLGLLAGGFFIWFAIRGVSTGEVPLRFSTLRRSDGAPLFWFGIGMNLIVGIGCLLGFIFGIDVFKELSGRFQLTLDESPSIRKLCGEQRQTSNRGPFRFVTAASG
jgi:hypothetical protein